MYSSIIFAPSHPPSTTLITSKQNPCPVCNSVLKTVSFNGPKKNLTDSNLISLTVKNINTAYQKQIQREKTGKTAGIVLNDGLRTLKRTIIKFISLVLSLEKIEISEWILIKKVDFTDCNGKKVCSQYPYNGLQAVDQLAFGLEIAALNSCGGWA